MTDQQKEAVPGREYEPSLTNEPLVHPRPPSAAEEAAIDLENQRIAPGREEQNGLLNRVHGEVEEAMMRSGHFVIGVVDFNKIIQSIRASLPTPPGETKQNSVLHEAARELLEVANLRGDNELPHPCDDPGLWTARMQAAWDELEHVIVSLPPPQAEHPRIWEGKEIKDRPEGTYLAWHPTREYWVSEYWEKDGMYSVFYGPIPAWPTNK